MYKTNHDTQKTDHGIHCRLVGGMILILSSVLGLSDGATAKDLCKNAATIEIEEPGLISYSGGALELLFACNQGRSALIEESDSSLTFAALEPGKYFIGLKNDPNRRARDLELTTHFAKTETREDTLKVGSIRALKTELYFSPSSPESRPVVTVLTLPETLTTKEEHHEVDPDPYSSNSFETGDLGSSSAQVVLLHRENLLKEEHHEVDPDPYATEVSSEESLLLHALIVATAQPGEYLLRVSESSALR